MSGEAVWTPRAGVPLPGLKGEQSHMPFILPSVACPGASKLARER